jgi:hypothetical protein
MKIKFINVGRQKKTWVADYPKDKPLAEVADDENWWARQLRCALMSTPDWAYNEKDDCVYIFAGFYCVGKAVVEKGGGDKEVAKIANGNTTQEGCAE